uniref:Uncharacterized protein n=1 Tax=Anguilla anguilla TaxID=7936 RepID=A0A0E9PLN5_ANGAN
MNVDNGPSLHLTLLCEHRPFDKCY